MKNMTFSLALEESPSHAKVDFFHLVVCYSLSLVSSSFRVLYNTKSQPSIRREIIKNVSYIVTAFYVNTGTCTAS
jgi:hypothetical protein